MKTKGITLIALVITIIVLLILAGVSIATLTGENGILTQVTKSANETEIAQIEEEANLIYTAKKMEGNYTVDVSMSDVVSELKQKQYEIKTVVNDGNTITGISLDSEKSIEKNKTTTIRVKYLGNTDANNYYAVIKGENYLMTKSGNSIKISREASKVDDSESTDELKITSNNTLFTATLSGETITIEAGDTIGSEDLVIQYGSYSQKCVVSITEPAVNAATVSANASSYYGQIVDYGKKYDDSTDATNLWRIFYSDGEHIYLIADDYIHYDYAPKSAKGNTIYRNSDYRLSFDNVIQDYKGSASIKDEFGSKWLSSYWSKLSETENETETKTPSTNNNIKAVAYMLDTSIWNTDFKTDDAEYVIGGPTLEMFCASYKETHPDRYIECEAESNTNGYNVKWSTSTGSYSTNIGAVPKDEFNGIYIKSDYSKANSLWLASPSAGSTSHVMYADYRGYVLSSTYSYDHSGFRPLVSLISDIQLKMQADGHYEIVEK